MSSIHEGVSCDGCMAPNFAGDRYKCLRCYDFDLCARCYADERSEDRSDGRNIRDSNDEHQPTHPMQCIMTQQDFELTYRGDQSHSWDKWRVVIFTCPVCGAQGLSRDRLVSHVIEEHSSPPRSPTAQRFEMACPICISTDFYRVGFGDYMPNQLTDMAAHMQEHHTQAPSSTPNPCGQSTRAGGLSEFLRERDLRRVIMHNIPLVGNDSDFDESAPEGNRRNRGNARISSQRSDGLPRIRRRLADRSANDSSGMDDESSVQTTFALRQQSTNRQNASASSQANSETPPTGAIAIRMRSLRENSRTGDTTRSNSNLQQNGANTRGSVLGQSSQRNSRTSEALPDGSASFWRTFQSPITGFSRPSIQRPQPLTNGTSSERPGNVQPSARLTSARSGVRGTAQNDRNISASQRLITDVTRSLVENRISFNAAQRHEPSRQLTPRVIQRRERNQVETEMTRESANGNSVEGRNDSRVRLSSDNVRSVGRGGRTTRRRIKNTYADNNTNGVTTGQPVVTNSSGRPILVLPPAAQRNLSKERIKGTPQLRCAKLPLNERRQESAEKHYAAKQQSQVREIGSLQQGLCPLFTMMTKLSNPLPVLKIKREKHEGNLVSAIPKPVNKPAVGESTRKEIDIETPPLRLIMRVGRPLRSTFIQRTGTSLPQDVKNNDPSDDWWNRRGIQHFDADTLLRYSRRSRTSVVPNPADSAINTSQSADLLSTNRSEVATIPISRAIEVIRRLDARGARSHRPSATQSDASAAGSHTDYSLPASVLSGAYITGQDSIAEAVARDVVALSEASGVHLRHLHGWLLQNLIRRSEAAVQDASQTGSRPTTKHSNPSRAEKIRGAIRTRSCHETRDEDLCEYFQNCFKVPGTDVLLDGSITRKKRIFKPFRVKSKEENDRVLLPWLQAEEMQDSFTDASDHQLNLILKELFTQVPEFARDGYSVEDPYSFIKQRNISDEPMFDRSNGSDEDMLDKKCLSSDLSRSPLPYIVAGPITAVTTAQQDSESDYWRDYRFLHNRRDVFLLKKSIEVPPENMFDPSDWRFPRQLLLGVIDIPASIYLRSHYLPKMFSRVFRSNLRESLKLIKPSGDVQNLAEEIFELDNTKDLQWKRRISDDEVESRMCFEVHPHLWYLLDLAGFVEISS